MDNCFQCFVEIDSHKYDIEILEDISSVCFEDIFTKIRQIIKIALNEDIVFENNIFEVLDNNKTKGYLIDSFGHFVKHLSTIRIHRNPVIPVVYDNPLIIPYFCPQILPSNEISKSELIPHEYYCDFCPQLVDKIDPRLKKIKLNLNFESYKRYSDLMTTIKEMSDSNCDRITEYQWLNVIPYKMRAFGYNQCSPKLWKNCYELFLKKYIEVMDVSPNRFVACSLFPFFHEYNYFRFDTNNSDNYKKIMDLRQKMDKTEIIPTVVPTVVPTVTTEMTKKEKKTFNKLVKRLVDEEEDIKVYHLIVQLIDHGQIYKKKSKKKWIKISETLSKYGFSSKIYCYTNCREKFFALSAFYAQNYNKLNGNLEPKLQQIFDLFKIVHILDFTKVWSYSNSTHSLLRKLSHKEDIKQYLADLENRKLKFEIRDRNVSKINSQPIIDSDLRAVDMDLEDLVVQQMSGIKPVINSISSVSPPQQSYSFGQQSVRRVPPTDPRLNRRNCVISVPNGQTMVSLNRSLVNYEDISTDIETVTNVNTNGCESSSTVSSQKSLQTPVPRLDPRLNRINAKKTQPNNKSVAEAVPTQHTATNGLQSVTNSPNISKESHSSDSILPTKTIRSVFDPKIKSNVKPKDKDIPQRDDIIIERIVKLEPIIPKSFGLTHSAQPSSSSRDPRLKRKLEQQNSEQLKQSSVESYPQKHNKKLKMTPIEGI